MRLNDLSETQHSAIKAAIGFWLAHWDWECPTLFGLEKKEMQSIFEQWPEMNAGDEKKVALAINGSLRELLYGASAVPRAQVHEVCGLSYDEANALSKLVFERVSYVL